jgi:hypothetical protein
LLTRLDLQDAVFTLDALHCKKTLDMIVKSGNHYLVKLKGNQPKLKAAIDKEHREFSACGMLPPTIENKRSKGDQTDVAVRTAE